MAQQCCAAAMASIPSTRPTFSHQLPTATSSIDLVQMQSTQNSIINHQALNFSQLPSSCGFIR
ncbi:hypothetical protein PtA15_9A425 [Puccinia triticina]|uniref:Uncharacterized protein n=1 Tax=Puccinia triticina TaxID=208348 RepID=A0ABY7CSQ7_9BASI|nr:uncharacterized protein PtA15_9A425 [Puccinia triticina]WAQ88298.1 hypothetical protein PtA15_9A425 [Puccinia triticina]WAR60471.1 hypothetical protein PtB15_9B410 [Puccinia triticina]